MAASLPDLAKVPHWIQYADRGRLIHVDDQMSLPTTDQILNSVRLFQQASLDGTFVNN